MIYLNNQTYRNVAHCALEAALDRETKKRPKNPNWIEDERQLMFEIVNERREQLGKTPIPLADVERVERTAVGHTDYIHKFALYCSELAEDLG